MVASRLVVALAVVLLPELASAHPLHSTITEIVRDPAHGVVRATIRVFADDFGTAVARSTRGRVSVSFGPAWDNAALAYVTSSFVLEDRAGRRLALASCGSRRTSDLLWICVEAKTTEALEQLGVSNALLSDLFDDQVNVVQGVVRGTKKSMLFTKGDRAKRL